MSLHRESTTTWGWICRLGVIAVLAGSSSGLADAPRPHETITLFDGTSLRGWEGEMDWFRMEDGALVAGSMERAIPRNEFICTTSQYRDFELRLQVRLKGDPAKANAGIQIRSRRIPGHHEMIGYQADMGQHYWGALYDESRRRKVLAQPEPAQLTRILKPDDWNDYVIRCEGRRIQLWINGFQTVDYTEPDSQIEQTGIIGLQVHSGPPTEAWYRDITLRPLSPVRFRKHTINADSRFEAAGLLDVNRDNKTDIFCGGFWYEAPDWTKHVVREVPEQSEYHYDFANLPYDVDGDGWTDIVNAAWHNKTLFWIKNPGRSGQGFQVIDIDKPGNMETALLHDINGDGHVDILPAANNAPCWYEAAVTNGKTQWTKHELPASMKGHGMGAGDIDGDGRCDIVAPRGWLQQPASGPWTWHAEFELGSTSVPILAFDVDADGDTDILWGMGHGYGLYWLEQTQDGPATRTWTRHTIDDAWSQPHFPILADLDNDGRQDLVVGKRYRAHNGKDPGSEDPKCIYWYRYDPPSKQWDKHVVHEGGQVAFGISTAIGDMDRDGDLDIVAPGKSGLYLLENLLH
jgi:hypothetical protein